MEKEEEEEGDQEGEEGVSRLHTAHVPFIPYTHTLGRFHKVFGWIGGQDFRARVRSLGILALIHWNNFVNPPYW